MYCKWESCEMKGEPPNPVFLGPVRAALLALLGGDVAREIPEGEAKLFGKLLRDELRAKGYCAAAYGDPGARVSEDEVAVWSPGNPLKEHVDFCVATGATPGHCVIDPRWPFMTSRGFP